MSLTLIMMKLQYKRTAQQSYATDFLTITTTGQHVLVNIASMKLTMSNTKTCVFSVGNGFIRIAKLSLKMAEKSMACVRDVLEERKNVK